MSFGMFGPWRPFSGAEAFGNRSVAKNSLGRTPGRVRGPTSTRFLSCWESEGTEQKTAARQEQGQLRRGQEDDDERGERGRRRQRRRRKHEEEDENDEENEDEDDEEDEEDDEEDNEDDEDEEEDDEDNDDNDDCD